ncbi:MULTISPECIES: SPOR domain-containing protein [unclassified Acidovorax]|uniref:SPOR domain-containing protein n=1 Tax=unclassified Acidovorax TaxID=2684926 RepID=UPI0028830C02|nr:MULTISPECIES: SPOR domain-containing protein [unclassified Acidovorax]
MAFFKFRWPGQKAQGDNAKPTRRSRSNAHAESIDVMRRRARHRLIGAAVLVLIGIIGFPMLFDTQPRPVAVDIPIEIPDRNKVAPLVVPDTAKAPVAAEAQPAAQASGSLTGGSSAGLDAGEEVVASRNESKPSAPVTAASRTEANAAVRSDHKPEAKPEARHEARADTKPAAAAEPAKPVRNDDAARARALLEGRTAVAQQTQPATAAPKADEEARFIVQVGAFADADKAREARSKLERAGLKTYMQVVDTKDGKRTRVRAGPFANRPDADKAAGRIKALGLSASVLTL